MEVELSVGNIGKLKSIPFLSKVEQSEREILREFTCKIAALIHVEGDGMTAIPGLRLFRRTTPTSCISAAYEPSLIIYGQGKKSVQVGASRYICEAGTCQVTGVDMPVFSQVTEASPAVPILAMIFKLDLTLVREVLSQQEFLTPESGNGTRAMAIGRATPELITACTRLLDLLDAPEDVPYLSGLVGREVLYRVLRSSLGQNLRAIATLGDQSNRTAKAVAWLTANYAQPLHLEELAHLAQMAVSTFHLRFKSLTQMSPLQYQKRLRLHHARLRMMNDGLDAGSAAFEVGYESASQFSREYRRFFGQPPRRDVKARQGISISAGA